MAETDSHKVKVEKKAARPKKRKAGRVGRIRVRRNTAAYRAAAQEQAARVREEIDAALADARRTREQIEARIDEQLHRRPDAPEPGERAQTSQRRRAKKS